MRARLLVATAAALLLSIPPTAAQQPAAPPAHDLTTRYRFIEIYTVQDARAPVGSIGVYRVAYRLKENQSIDQAGGTPKRTERTRQAVYTERAAAVSPVDGKITDLVRQYESVKIVPDPGVKALEKLPIWYKTVPDDDPILYSLAAGKSLTDADYRLATADILLPELGHDLLPPTPLRVGDTWRVSPEAAEDLLGQRVAEGALTGRLAEVKIPEPGKPARVAVLDLSGKVTTEEGSTQVHAQVSFAFNAPAVAAEDAAIEARGAIVKLALAQTSTAPASPRDERLKINRKRELVVERKRGEGVPLAIPATPPKLTPENSWLAYVDRAGRFSFRHPQSMKVTSEDQLNGPGGAADPDSVYLIDVRPDAGDRPDLVKLSFVPRAPGRPDDFFKGLKEKWQQADQVEILPGATQLLPVGEWPEARAHRTELAVKQNSNRGIRVHIYGYVLQFKRDAALTVEASTTQEAPSTFRKSVEGMLKTFRPEASTGGK